MEKQIAGCVLAGGHSSRYGRNKALQSFEGSYFLKRAEKLLQGICENVYISVANKGDYPEFTESAIEDVYKECGPIGAIYSILLKSEQEKTLIIPCDMPALTIPIFQRMIDSSSNHDIVCYAQNHHPLTFPMLIDRKCLSVVAKAIMDKNYRIRDIMKKVDTCFIQTNADLADCFININTIDDFDAFLSSHCLK